MIIKQLELFRFRRFERARVLLAPGLNVIQGPNEAGKSTLRSALTTAFFGNPTSASEAVRGRRRACRSTRPSCARRRRARRR